MNKRERRWATAALVFVGAATIAAAMPSEAAPLRIKGVAQSQAVQNAALGTLDRTQKIRKSWIVETKDTIEIIRGYGGETVLWYALASYSRGVQKPLVLQGTCASACYLMAEEQRKQAPHLVHINPMTLFGAHNGVSYYPGTREYTSWAAMDALPADSRAMWAKHPRVKARGRFAESIKGEMDWLPFSKVKHLFKYGH